MSQKLSATTAGLLDDSTMSPEILTPFCGRAPDSILRGCHPARLKSGGGSRRIRVRSGQDVVLVSVPTTPIDRSEPMASVRTVVSTVACLLAVAVAVSAASPKGKPKAQPRACPAEKVEIGGHDIAKILTMLGAAGPDS